MSVIYFNARTNLYPAFPLECYGQDIIYDKNRMILHL